MAKVYVKDGDLEYALNRFKEFSNKDGIIADYNKHLFYKSKRDRRKKGKAYVYSKRVNK